MRFLIGGLLLFIAFIWAVGTTFQKKEEEWQKFKVEHHCRKVGVKEGTVLPTVTTQVNPNGTLSTGVATVIVPEQIAWQCDDGVTYWR